jgi:hypothetical protein
VGLALPVSSPVVRLGLTLTRSAKARCVRPACALSLAMFLAKVARNGSRASLPTGARDRTGKLASASAASRLASAEPRA